MAQTPEPGNVIRPSQFVPPPGGSGPNDPTVEARLARLEVAVDEIRKELQAIRIDLARIEGRLSNLPTTLQLVFMQATIIVAVFAAAVGLSLALIRLAASH
jgi:hypothetical protein